MASTGSAIEKKGIRFDGLSLRIICVPAPCSPLADKEKKTSHHWPAFSQVKNNP